MCWAFDHGVSAWLGVGEICIGLCIPQTNESYYAATQAIGRRLTSTGSCVFWNGYVNEAGRCRYRCRRPLRNSTASGVSLPTFRDDRDRRRLVLAFRESRLSGEECWRAFTWTRPI